MVRKNLARRMSALFGAAACVLLSAPLGHAETVTYSFTRFSTNGSVNPESQFTLEVRDFDKDNNTLAGQVSFLFRNTGLIASSITGTHFEDGAVLGIAYVNSGPGVDFSEPGSGPPSLPEGIGLSPAFVTTKGFTARADPPRAANGVNPGEWLEIIVDLKPDLAYGDVITAISNGFKRTSNLPYSGNALRVGLHVQAIGGEGGFSDGFILSQIPLPAPVGLALAGLAGVVIITRRKRKASVALD